MNSVCRHAVVLMRIERPHELIGFVLSSTLVEITRTDRSQKMLEILSSASSTTQGRIIRPN
jgi:hypothetical protein